MKFHMKIQRCLQGLQGTIQVPGDKSISHRAVMLGALAEGITTVEGFLPGADCLSTIDCFRRMGVEIEHQRTNVRVNGVGMGGLQSPKEGLDVGNSGTTIRLMLGILSGQRFSVEMTGDASIEKRPMKRVVNPLRQMGACITGREDGNFAPLLVTPTDKLHGIIYKLPMASAQVKSALLLAGLYAEGVTVVEEGSLSRDHTEIMLQDFGVKVERRPGFASVVGGQKLIGRHVAVPGDISSAAFPIVAALITPGSDILVKNVGVNPTRTGILDVLKQMGADLEIRMEPRDSAEPVAEIRARYSQLKGTTISGDIIPRLIDEIPILAIAAAAAEGETAIRDAAELRVKETDRIGAVIDGLRAMGGVGHSLEDGMIIPGRQSLHGGQIISRGDHRIAMSFAVAGMVADGVTEIDDDDCIAVSFPGFAQLMRNMGAVME